MVAKVCLDDLELHHLDIKTAFLNGKIDTLVYVKQPPGYQLGPVNLACRLHKGLYGLKQSPRIWHARLKDVLQSIGYGESSADPSLFISSTGYILTYVDDLLIAPKDLSSISATKSKLMSTFGAHDLGEASVFFGMTINRDRAAKLLHLGEEHMIKDLLIKYNLKDCKSKAGPISPSIKLSKDRGDPLDTSVYAYSALVGSLLYLSVCTRPDIAQSVGTLARYMSCPTTAHWDTLKGVVRYLAGTAGYRLHFNGDYPDLIGYCDADYASDIDTRCSTTGYVFMIAGTAISWSSRRQTTVAASTTEAEYMAAAHATKEALWLRKLCTDLQLADGPVNIYSDNQSAIKLLKNPIASMRSKHIDVIYHFAASASPAARSASTTSGPTRCWPTSSPRQSPRSSTSTAARASVCTRPPQDKTSGYTLCSLCGSVEWWPDRCESTSTGQPCSVGHQTNLRLVNRVG